MPEQFANNVQTTLAGAIASGATSLVVASAAGFPSTGPFRFLIDAEIFLCTARSGTTCTVIPGAEGTTPAAHLTLAPVTLIVTAGALRAVQSEQVAPVTFTRATNSSSALYVIDGGAPDYRILHAHAGPTSYVLPAPTDGRTLELQDITGGIESPANWVFLVPHGTDLLNASSGLQLTEGGDLFSFTNGSPVVTAPSGHFRLELAVGMSIASDNQPGVHYLVASIESATALTLASNFTGETTTTTTAKRTSLTFAANFGRLSIQSDGVDWYVKGDGTPTRVRFVDIGDNQIFVPPPGLYSALLVGCGSGGWGGTGGGMNSGTMSKTGGGGGGGAIEGRVTLSLVPNTVYQVFVGSMTSFGGDWDPASGQVFPGGSGGANGDDPVEPGAGGLCVTSHGADIHNFFNPTDGRFGLSLSSGGNAIPGGDSSIQFGADSPTNRVLTGPNGSAFGTYGAGASGGAGPRGPAGPGGDASADDVGLAGGNAAAGSGAGGGGGGSGPNGGGPPGHGGTGYLDVIYVL